MNAHGIPPDHEHTHSSSTSSTAGILLALWLASILARMACAKLVPGPVIFTDEWNYLEMARSASIKAGFFWGEVPLAFPCWLYPWTLVPFIRNWPTAEAHQLILAMNAALISLTPLMVFGMVAPDAGRRRALVAALLAALLPTLGYSATIMAENLFLPLFTLGIWMGWRALREPTAGRRVAAGLAMGLAFHAKPQGLYLPIIFGLSAVGCGILELLESPRGGGRWTRLLRDLPGHGLTAAAWLAALAPRMAVVLWVEKPEHPFSLAAFLGGYSETAAGARATLPSALLTAFIGNLGLIVLATGWFPLPAILGEARRALRPGGDRGIRSLTVLILFAILFVSAIVARHTVKNDELIRVHERYLLILFPSILALYAIVSRRAGERGPLAGQAAPWISIAAGAGLMGFAIHVAWPTLNNLLSDTPSLAALILFARGEQPPIWSLAMALALACCIGVMLSGWFLPKLRLPAMSALFLVLNWGWYGSHHEVFKTAMAGERAIAASIDRIIPEGDRLLLLEDGLPRDLFRQVGFRNAGRQVYLDAGNRSWWTSPLALAEDGTVLSPEPSLTWLLAGAEWGFNRKPVRDYGVASLHRLDDAGDPLKLLPGEVKAKVEAWKPVEHENRITYEDLEYPGRWRAGQTVKVRVTVRNDSPAALSTKTAPLEIGYHWSDPERLGNWNAVVFDDGNSGAVAADLKPGASCRVELEVTAPAQPSETWRLTLAPLVVDGPLRTWLEPNYVLIEKVSILAP